MPFIRKRRIWWEPVEGVSSYVVYVSSDNAIFTTNFSWEATPGIVFKVIKGRTELIIPDEWPEFPTEPGTYYIGITSKDEAGNQSDPFVSTGLFKFFPPAAPQKGGISDNC